RQLWPDFAAVLLRGSVATEYYKASGGDIVATQDVLNHARADTTELYINGPQTRRIQRETIARLQELMLGWIVGAKAATEDQAQRDCFELLYAPSLRILTDDILPDFPHSLHAEAERWMSALPTLPALE